jgi:putative NADPH-quinone reductase
MSENIKKIFVVLVSADESSPTFSLCKNFVRDCLSKGIEVDVVDLYKENKDDEFNPLFYPEEKEDTKSLEYQIRISKASLIVFFYPIWWENIPGILKTFIEKVFTRGFAYFKYKNKYRGFLKEKRVLAVGLNSEPTWKNQFLFGNIINNWWEKVFFRNTESKGKSIVFGNIINSEDKNYLKTEREIEKITAKLNSEDSVLDLF